VSAEKAIHLRSTTFVHLTTEIQADKVVNHFTRRSLLAEQFRSGFGLHHRRCDRDGLALGSDFM
jgi:hypothetical protein